MISFIELFGSLVTKTAEFSPLPFLESLFYIFSSSFVFQYFWVNIFVLVMRQTWTLTLKNLIENIRKEVDNIKCSSMFWRRRQKIQFKIWKHFANNVGSEHETNQNYANTSKPFITVALLSPPSSASLWRWLINNEFKHIRQSSPSCASSTQEGKKWKHWLN